MSTLATYKQRLTEKLAQSSTAFHTNDARTSAINEAIKRLAEQYDIPDLIKKITITAVAGISDFPTDYFRMVKLWLTSTPVREFTYIPEDSFDTQDPTSANDYWTEDYVIGVGRKLLTVPTNETAFTSRYVKKPTVLVNDADESGISTFFDPAVAYMSASILLDNEKDFNKSTQFELKAAASIKAAIQSTRKRGGVKQGERLRSRFEKYPLLNNGSLNTIL